MVTGVQNTKSEDNLHVVNIMDVDVKIVRFRQTEENFLDIRHRTEYIGGMILGGERCEH